MQKKRVVLSFPPQLIDQAVTYRLIKDFDLMINIMRARITPKEQGRLVVEITERNRLWTPVSTTSKRSEWKSSPSLRT